MNISQIKINPVDFYMAKDSKPENPATKRQMNNNVNSDILAPIQMFQIEMNKMLNPNIDSVVNPGEQLKRLEQTLVIADHKKSLYLYNNWNLQSILSYSI